MPQNKGNSQWDGEAVRVVMCAVGTAKAEQTNRWRALTGGHPLQDSEAGDILLHWSIGNYEGSRMKTLKNILPANLGQIGSEQLCHFSA
jgi:hypothetical protein